MINLEEVPGKDLIEKRNFLASLKIGIDSTRNFEFDSVHDENLKFMSRNAAKELISMSLSAVS